MYIGETKQPLYWHMAQHGTANSWRQDSTIHLHQNDEEYSKTAMLVFWSDKKDLSKRTLLGAQMTSYSPLPESHSNMIDPADNDAVQQALVFPPESSG